MIEGKRLKDFLKKLNYAPIFDPSRWPRREFLARLGGVCVCVAFIIPRILRFNRYTGEPPPLLRILPEIARGESSLSGICLGTTEWHWIMWFTVWTLETGILVGYIFAFISRNEARNVAKGFMEVVFPFIIAAIPLVITLSPMNFRRVWPPLLLSLRDSIPHPSIMQWATPVFQNWEPVFFLFLTAIIGGGLINLTGLLTLRSAFTIMSEARVLIRQGIFSRIRHPLYAGHFIMFFGYLMFHLYWYTCILYIVFVLGQYLRARIEEHKLSDAFPEYSDYMRTTGMFFPLIKKPFN
jgi:hypothetical protein